MLSCELRIVRLCTYVHGIHKRFRGDFSRRSLEGGTYDSTGHVVRNRIAGSGWIFGEKRMRSTLPLIQRQKYLFLSSKSQPGFQR